MRPVRYSNLYNQNDKQENYYFEKYYGSRISKFPNPYNHRYHKYHGYIYKRNKANEYKRRIQPFRSTKLKSETNYPFQLKKLIKNINISKNQDVDCFPNMYNISKDSILLHLDKKNRYDIVRIGLHNQHYKHVCVALIDKELKTIELFDTIGETIYFSYNCTRIESYMLQFILKKYYKNYNFNLINWDLNIQNSSRDKYCQSWIYYYIYKRLYENKSNDQILADIRNMSSNRRIEEITNFISMFCSI